MGFGKFMFEATKFVGKATWCTSKFVVKNAPTAIGIAWQVKKEITEEIVQIIEEEKKAYKEQKRLK
jgi:hypothetical protein